MTPLSETLPIRAVVGHADLVSVRTPAVGVRFVRYSRRASAVGFGEAPGHATLYLVPRKWGQTAPLAGGLPAL